MVEYLIKDELRLFRDPFHQIGVFKVLRIDVNYQKANAGSSILMTVYCFLLLVELITD
jgi:hypothetical protein